MLVTMSMVAAIENDRVQDIAIAPPIFFTSMRCSIDPMANCHAFGSQLTKVAQSGWTVGLKAALRSFGNFACHSLVRRFSSWKLHTPGCDIGI